MTDRLELLAHSRLPAADLEREWAAAEQRDVLARVLADRPAPRRTRRRWVLTGCLGAAAAASVVATVLLPAGAPGGPDRAAAAALHRLSLVAGQQGASVPAGSYVYTRTGAMQAGEDRVDQAWLSPNGDFWGVSGASPSCLLHLPHTVNYVPDGGYQLASVDDLSVLPTDPDALAGYFDDHPSGDNRGAGNRLIAVGDLLRDGVTPAALRAAALEVLAQTPGIAVDPDAHDWRGRPAIKVSQTAGDVTTQLFFDPQTSQIVAEQTLQDGAPYYVGHVLESRVVDSVQSDAPPCS